MINRKTKEKTTINFSLLFDTIGQLKNFLSKYYFSNKKVEIYDGEKVLEDKVNRNQVFDHNEDKKIFTLYIEVI